jgi:hypothetical protein
MVFTSFRKLPFPGALEIVFARCREHMADKMQTKMTVQVVGINPALWKVAGKFSMAGPVKELLAIDMDPKNPILPM